MVEASELWFLLISDVFFGQIVKSNLSKGGNLACCRLDRLPLHACFIYK